MGTYNKRRLLTTSTSQIPRIAEAICKDFEIDGFEVNIDTLMSGGRDISITKGNLFKAILGMRSALKITLTPQSDGVLFDANVGIYGQQSIPTVITMLFFWPVLITQIWGLVEQSQLDDRALAVAERVIAIGGEAANPSSSAFMNSASANTAKHCTNCGTKIPEGAKFCSECGTQI